MSYSPWGHKRVGHSWATEHTQRNFLVRQMWRVEFRRHSMQRGALMCRGLDSQQMWYLSGTQYSFNIEYDRWGRVRASGKEGPKLRSLDKRMQFGVIRSVNMNTTDGWLRLLGVATFSWTVWGTDGQTQGDQSWGHCNHPGKAQEEGREFKWHYGSID